MSPTWQASDPVPDPPPPGLAGWVRLVLRGLALGLVTYGCLLLLLILRLIERPLFGLRRPVTPYITQFVCRSAFVILGIRHVTRGTPMRERGAAVANHASWLDIFTLNAPQRIYYVSKSEVAGWPGIGWLARATGTVFIARRGREAMAQRDLFEARLRAGHHLMFFPEGTSTDGLRVLRFKSTLFEAFYARGLDEILSIQPISVTYHAPEGADPRFYAWWGEMSFAAHLRMILAAPRQGRVEVVFHPPIRVADHPDRKTLAAACEAAVRAGFGHAAPAGPVPVPAAVRADG